MCTQTCSSLPGKYLIFQEHLHRRPVLQFFNHINSVLYYLRNINCSGYYVQDQEKQYELSLSIFYRGCAKNNLLDLYGINEVQHCLSMTWFSRFHCRSKSSYFSLYLPYTFAFLNAILITGLLIADSLTPILSPLSCSAEIAENQLLQMSFASPLPVIRWAPTVNFSSFELPSGSRGINVIPSIQPILLI